MTETKANNITWHDHKVGRQERWQAAGHKGAVLWFTGLSGSGKSSIANEVDHLLHSRGKRTYVLDGDNVRHGLNKDLGFSAEDRKENIRRVGEVAKLFADAGVITSTAFISPYRSDRNLVRELFDRSLFVEIFVDASLETCEARDPKGLYQKARDGQIKGFTGVNAPYEKPDQPEIVLNSNFKDVNVLAAEVIAWLDKQGILNL